MVFLVQCMRAVHSSRWGEFPLHLVKNSTRGQQIEAVGGGGGGRGVGSPGTSLGLDMLTSRCFTYWRQRTNIFYRLQQIEAIGGRGGESNCVANLKTNFLMILMPSNRLHF